MPVDQKIRLLIVDDDPSIVRLLGHFASALWFETLEAVNPKDALELATRQKVDAALIDLHIPGMEGIELMRSLRKLNADMQVIVITGDRSSKARAFSKLP